MNIIVLGKQMDIGGTEVAMIALLNRLVKEGNSVTLLLKNKKGALIDRIPNSVIVDELDIGNSEIIANLALKTVNKQSLIKKYISRFLCIFLKQNGKVNNLYRFILKHTPTYPGQYDLLLDFFGYSNFMTAYGAKKISAKHKATWFHCEDIKKYWGTAANGKVNEYLPYYDKYFCVSDAVKAEFDRVFPDFKRKSEVLLNFVDKEEIIRRSFDEIDTSEMKGKFVLLTVGRLDKQKGIDIAIRAAAVLKLRNIDFQWYVIGDGKMRNKLSQLVHDLAVQDRFILLGSRNNPYPYMRKCDLYIQPSRHEGYSISILEAKTICKPIIVSDIPSNRIQIQDGINGVICDLNEYSIADKIVYLHDNKEIAQSLVENLKKEQLSFEEEYSKLKQLAEID